jgi:hypothetical protein
MINAGETALRLDVDLYGLRADPKFRRQPGFGLGYRQRLHARSCFGDGWAQCGGRSWLEFELLQFDPKLFQGRISDRVTPLPMPFMAQIRELANLKKPALLPSSVKPEFLDDPNLAYQKSAAVTFRPRFRLPDTHDVFLLVNPVFRPHPGPGPAMGKERLNCFAGENGNGRMGQGTHSGLFKRYL